MILHPVRGIGDDFKLLGLLLDCKLHMDGAITDILKRARPKLHTLMRSRPYYNDVDMVLQFKTHILGIIESNIGGIYHATNTVLAPLDRLATSFVHALNMEMEEAFMNYNLAPSALRRDIAMLGFLHKCNLPNVHPHIRELFPPCRVGGSHNKQMWDIMTFENGTLFQNEMRRRSVFQLVHVYNALPQNVVSLSLVSEFQHELTQFARNKCNAGHADWQIFLSPRHFRGSLTLV